jgi:hypothetical protein
MRTRQTIPRRTGFQPVLAQPDAKERASRAASAQGGASVPASRPLSSACRLVSQAAAFGLFLGSFLTVPALSAAPPPPLAAGTQPGSASGAALLRWEDEATGKVLFSLDDIVRFDWDRQVFELKRERAMDLLVCLVPHLHLSRSFVVRDSQGVIYAGRFISPAMSATYAGPTIQTGLAEVEPPLYAIQGGYPARLAGGDDRRFAPRLRQALEQGGVLKAIPANEKAVPIQRLSTEWLGERDNLRVRAELFPETFRLGQPARVHLFFVFGKAGPPPFDTVQLESSLTQPGGFFCTVDHSIAGKLTADAVKGGVHILRWKPWGPVYGAAETTAKAGAATLSLRVTLRKNTPRGEEAVCSVAIPAQALTILASAPASAAAGTPDCAELAAAQAARIKPILPKGWSIAVKKNVLTVRRDQPIAWYGTISLPAHRDKAELKAAGFVHSSTYQIEVEYAPPMTDAEAGRLAKENDQMTRAYDLAHPKPASGKPLAPPKELTDQLHRIPNVRTPAYSCFLTVGPVDDFSTAFYDDAVKTECTRLKQQVLRIVGAEE